MAPDGLSLATTPFTACSRPGNEKATYAGARVRSVRDVNKTMNKIEDAQAPADRRPDPLRGRLGLNVPAQWWPTAPSLKAVEAAGFNWVQLHSPPRTVLCDPAQAARHATATRGVLSTTGLRAVIHAPDELLAGTPEHDRALAGLIDYATIAGAEIVVYHGRNIRPGARAGERALAEE